MGVGLADLLAKSRTIEIEIGGETVTVTYDPSVWTVRFQRETVPKVDYPEVLAKVVVDWDLTDPDGKPLPVTVDAMLDWPPNIWQTIGIAISLDIAEGKAMRRQSTSSESSRDSDSTAVENAT